MIFNGVWYCYMAYTLDSSEIALGDRLLSDDYCSQVFGSTTHVVKISEPREYEYLFRMFRTEVHLGVTLDSGTTYRWLVFIRDN